MSDDVKKTLEMVPHGHKADHAQLWAHLKVLAAHIDAEPARLVAAVAREREEQREADAQAALRAGTPGHDLRIADIVRATPLTATPLADENKALREDLEHERKTNARLLAERDEALKAAEQAWHVETMSRERREAIQRAESAEAIRDAALTQRDTALARVRELEAEVEVAWSDCEPTKPGPYGTAYVHDGCGACARCVDAARAERDAALERVKELEDYPKRLAMVLGWMNTPAVDVLERDVRARDYRIESLVARVAELEEGNVRRQVALETERDAALARVRELEREAEEIEQDSHAWDKAMDEEEKAFAKGANEWMRHLLGPDWGRLWGPHLEAFGRGVDNMMVRVGKAEAERDALKAQLDEAEAELRELRVADECRPATSSPECSRGATSDSDWCRSCLLARYRVKTQQLDEAVTVLLRVTEALEGSFPGDESVGWPEFPEVSMTQAWTRRIEARAFLAKYPEGR